MERRLPLLVALAALTAGCAGLAGPVGSAPDGDAGTLTPVPVDGVATATPPVVRDGRLPPGVEPDGSVDADRLVEAHAATLANRSYTATFRRVDRRVDDAGGVTDLRLRRDGNRTAVVDADGTDPARSWFLTDREGYRRTVDGNRTDYDAVSIPVRPGRTLRTESVLDRYVEDWATEVDVVRRDGRRYVRLFVPPGAADSGPVDLRRFTATAYVTLDGRVRSVTAEYALDETAVEVRLAYRRVGSTEVAVPDWVSTAREVTATASRAGSEDTPSNESAE